jgi:Tfp pilus assembly protein PilZ
MAKSSKQKPKSLTALAKSLDTRKRPPPALPARGGEIRGALLRPKIEHKLAALAPLPVVPPRPAVVPPKAPVVVPPKAAVIPPKPAVVVAPRPAPASTSLSRASALASMQRSPSPVPARVPTASAAKPAVVLGDARRQYPRAEIHVRAHLSLADDPSRYFEAALPTVNLSVGGMFLESSFFLKIGTKLLVTLQLPQKGREVKVKAEVVRVESNVLGASGFAVRFTEYLDGSQVTLATHFLSPVLREFLSQYAKEHRFQASAEYLAHTADVLAAWELKKAELGGDVWDLFSSQKP